MSSAKPYHSSQRQDWITPQWVWDILSAEYTYVFDPCPAVDPADRPDFTLSCESDGLTAVWPARGVTFVNPPYGQEGKAWAKKIVYEAELGKSVIALVRAGVNSKSCQALMKVCDWVHCPTARLRFVLPGTGGDGVAGAPFDSIFIGYNTTCPFTSGVTLYGDQV